MPQSTFLQVGLEAVRAAEEVILHYYETNVTVEVKADVSPVTIADKETEQIIREVISNAFPDHGFMGEEFGVENEEAEYHWVIDPIDGTKEFLRGIPFFGTQLALVKGSDFILGICNAPALKDLVYAERGNGAFKNDQPIHVSSISNLEDAHVLTGGAKYFSRTNTLDQMIGLVEHSRGNRVFGSQLGYQFLAEGKVDAMVEIETYLWDIAAYTAIIQEAGGKVTTRYGDPIPFEKKVSIIATNGLIHDQVLGFFNP